MRWHLGLKARFIGFILVLLTLMFATIAGILLRTNSASLRENLLARSSAFAALATRPIGEVFVTYRDSGTVLISQQITNFTKLDDNVTDITVVDTRGTVQHSLSGKAKPISALQAETFQPIILYDDRHTINRIISPFIEADGRHRYAIIYDISTSSIDTAVTDLTRSIVTYSLLGLLFSAAVTYVLVNWLFLMPIRRLRDQAVVISSGYYNEQLSQTRKDEIGDLARTVNHMADNLKADIQKLTETDRLKSEFMMIASHNLRTPLTAIDGYTDMAASLANTPELKDMLENIQINSRRLSTFAEDLLLISNIESGQKLLRSEQVDLAKLLRQTIKDFHTLADDKHITLSDTIPDSAITVAGSNPHLRSAVWNLLENALKFTAEKGTITVSLQQHDGHAEVRITDSGIGIAPEEIPKLFTKFHRGTSTLHYNYDGTGIGLYVTKLIITEFGGTITAESTVGKGSTFSVTLPLATIS